MTTDTEPEEVERPRGPATAVGSILTVLGLASIPVSVLSGSLVLLLLSFTTIGIGLIVVPPGETKIDPGI